MSAWDSRPPGTTPTIGELAEQVDVLTAALKANGVPTTIAALQRKLELTWHPDAGVLLGSASVTHDMLATAAVTLADLGVAVGIDSWTFAAARTSAAKVTTHNAGFMPTKVFVCGSTDQGARVVAGHAFTYTSTQFTSRGDFTDGTAPTGTSAFVWIAVR